MKAPSQIWRYSMDDKEIINTRVGSLPGWHRFKLAEICDFRHGGTPSKEKPEYWNGLIPWVSPKDMKTNVIADTEDHISEMALETSSTGLVPAGTILVVVRSGILAHSLPVALTSREVAFNQDIKALQPNVHLVEPRFLLFSMRQKEPEIISQGIKKGATVHSIKSGYLENLYISLPTLAEQKRIAGILNERMAAIDKARAAAEAQLVAAEALPAAYLKQVFPKQGQELPPGWRWGTIGEVSDVVNGYGFPEQYQGNRDGPYPFIKVSDMNAEGSERIVFSAINTVDLNTMRTLKARACPAGTVIFPKVGGALLTNKKRILGRESCFDNNVMGLEPRDIDSEYLYYWIMTVDLRSLSNVQALPSIKQSRVSALPIAIPPGKEQKRISSALLDTMSVIEEMKSRLLRQLNKMNALPQALLRQAFNGEL